MTSNRDEGLGLSVLVYAAVMAGALVLLMLPVLWANGTTVYENPQLPKYDLASSRPLADQHKQIPLARLKRDELVDAKALAAINQPQAKPERSRVREARERPSRSTSTRAAYAQAHDYDEAPRPRRGWFGLSLF